MTSHPTILRTCPQLSIGDAETLAVWFLKHAGPELRARLMGDLPLAYARTYPGVDPDVILRNVRIGIDRVRDSQSQAFAELAAKHDVTESR